MTKKLTALALMISLMLSVGLCPFTTASQSQGSDGILRLHIIANSDSRDDQQVKLVVRDAILEYAADNFTATDADEAVCEVMACGGDILITVEETLKSEGFDYGDQLKLGRYDFPDRWYGDTLYEADEYKALRVVLGDGAGENWWCVIFPPLCIVDAAEGKTEPEEVQFESLFLKILRSLFGGGDR